MPIAVADARSAIRSVLNETTAGFYTDAEIDVWIAHGTLEISGIAKCIEAVSEITLQANVREYALPSSSIEALHVQLDATRQGVRKLTPSLAGAREPVTSGDTPTGWWEWRRYLYVEPTPDADAHGKKLLVYYASFQADVTALPDIYYAQVVDFALYRGLQKDRRYAEATQVYSAFTNGVAFKRVDIYQRVPHSDSDLELPATDVALTRRQEG